MTNILDMLDPPVIAEPLSHFTDNWLNSGRSLMVTIIVEFNRGDTELSLKVTSCPTLFVSLCVNPGRSMLPIKFRCMLVIDWCMKLTFQRKKLLCCRGITQVSATVPCGQT